MSRANFRLPELGIEQSQVQMVSPTIQNQITVAVPKNNNAELLQILGIIGSIGDVARQSSQQQYYYQQTVRARMGMAAEAAQSAAMPLADQFATNTLGNDVLSTISNVTPEDMPQTVRRISLEAANRSADESGLVDEERQAYVESYDREVMRWAMPWTRGIIDSHRADIAASLSQDLRLNGTSVEDSFAGWKATPSLAGMPRGQFLADVVVPAMQTAAEDNDWSTVSRIYEQLAESNEITPRVADIYARTRASEAAQRLAAAVEVVGTQMASGSSSDEDQWMSGLRETIAIGGRSPDFAAAMGNAAEEMLARGDARAMEALKAILIDESPDGGLTLPFGHPARDKIHSAIRRYESTGDEGGWTDRQRQADVLMATALFEGKSQTEVVELLRQRYGNEGNWHATRIGDIGQKLDRSAGPANQNLTNTHLMMVDQAALPSDLDEIRRSAENDFSTGRIGVANVIEIVGRIEKRSATLPLDWTQFDATRELESQWREYYYGAQPGMLNVTGDPRDAEVTRRYLGTIAAAKRSWRSHVSTQLADRRKAAEEAGKRFTLDEQAKQDIYDAWATEAERHTQTIFSLRGH